MSCVSICFISQSREEVQKSWKMLTITSGSRAVSSWGQAPEVSIIVHGHCEILIKSRYYWYLKLELKMHPVPNTSWIGKNIFLLKKNSRIEMPNRFEDNHLCWNKARRSPAFWAGLSELWSHFVRWGAGCPGVSVASVPAWVSWQYLLYSKLSFNSFLAHSDCYSLISHQ